MVLLRHVMLQLSIICDLYGLCTTVIADYDHVPQFLPLLWSLGSQSTCKNSSFAEVGRSRSRSLSDGIPCRASS